MKTFILVEDDPLDAKHFLKQAGMLADLQHKGTFRSVPEALGYLTANEQPDIIFSDINLPGIDGFSVSGTFLNLSKALIYVTGETGHEKKVLEERADGMLWKPVHASDMQKLVNQRFSRRKKAETAGPNPMELSFSSVMLYDVKDKAYHKVNINEMKSLIHSRNYLDVLIKPDISRTVRMTLSEALLKLAPVNWFIQVNQSIIVNVLYIQKAEKDLVCIGDEEEESWVKYPVTIRDRGYDDYLLKNRLGNGGHLK